MGATLASLVSLFPWITIISQYKRQIFIIAGFLLVISIYFYWQGRNAPCPSDRKEAKICSKFRFGNLIIIQTHISMAYASASAYARIYLNGSAMAGSENYHMGYMNISHNSYAGMMTQAQHTTTNTSALEFEIYVRVDLLEHLHIRIANLLQL